MDTTDSRTNNKKGNRIIVVIVVVVVVVGVVVVVLHTRALKLIKQTNHSSTYHVLTLAVFPHVYVFAAAVISPLPFSACVRIYAYLIIVLSSVMIQY